MILFGTIHRVGDDISSEQIFDPVHDSSDPAFLAGHCLERVDPTLADQVNEGDVLAAGSNFGAGEPAELAILALQALGFAAIICVSAAPTFVETAEVYGLPIVVSSEASRFQTGQQVRIDLARAIAKNVTSQAQFSFPAFSAAMLAAVRRHTMLGRMRRVVEEEGFEG